MRDRWRSASDSWWLGSRGRSGSAGSFRVDFRYGGWGRGIVFQYVGNFDRGISAKFKFQIGLAVGVR